MRGDGDQPVSEQLDVALPKRMAGNQRKILSEGTGRPMKDVLQLWALYKKVRDITSPACGCRMMSRGSGL